MPDWTDPPPEEPPGENLIGPEDLCPADPLWEGFYAVPFVLPPDPLKVREALQPQT